MDKFEQEKSTLLELPILIHFDVSTGEIALKSGTTLKNGEKNLSWGGGGGVFGTGGYVRWTYLIGRVCSLVGGAGGRGVAPDTAEPGRYSRPGPTRF